MLVKIDKKFFENKEWTHIDSNKLYEVRNKMMIELGMILYYVHVPGVPTNGLVPERPDYQVRQWFYIKSDGPKPVGGRLKEHTYIPHTFVEEVDPSKNAEAKSFLEKEW